MRFLASWLLATLITVYYLITRYIVNQLPTPLGLGVVTLSLGLAIFMFTKGRDHK